MTEHTHPQRVAASPKSKPRVLYLAKPRSPEDSSPKSAIEFTALARLGPTITISPEPDVLERVAKVFPGIQRPTTLTPLVPVVGETGVEGTAQRRTGSLDLKEIKITYDIMDVGSEDPYAIAALLRAQGAHAFVEGPPTNPPLSKTELAQQAEIEAAARKEVKKRIAGLSQPQQGYLNAAPLGIAARHAWTYKERVKRSEGSTSSTNSSTSVSGERNETSGYDGTHEIKGFRGQEIQLADVEQGWQLKHIEIDARKVVRLNSNREFFGHGTAVLGIVAAENDEVQITGIAHELKKIFVVSQWDNKSHYATACAIKKAADRLEEGDILLIEAQTIELGGSVLLPVEIEEPVFHAIQNAVQKGIVVVEAAGNGGFDLDDWYDINGERPLRRRTKEFLDSGAIMVGASLPPRHTLAPFSNRGSRIDCFAWGSKVYTAGDGSRGRSKSDYTADFTGTSAAAAIIAGAAAVVQSLVKRQRKTTFDSKTMRSFLANPSYGTPSADPPHDQIGVMPDLKKIFAAIDI